MMLYESLYPSVLRDKRQFYLLDSAKFSVRSGALVGEAEVG